MSPRASREARTLLVEIGVLALVFPAVNVLFFRHDPGFASLSPHPTLFITLLVVASYGLVPGLIAAAVLTAEYVLLIAILGQETTFHYLLSPPLSTPLVVLVPVTVFLGMLVQRHIDRRRKAEELSLRAGEQAERVAAELSALRDVNVQLGEKIVHSDTTLFVLFDHLKGLSTLDRDELNAAVLRMLVEMVHVEGASVWDVDGGALRLRTFVGSHPPESFPLDLADEAFFDQHDVLAAHKLPPEICGQLPLLIGRIRAGAAGPLIGYLTIDQIPLRFSAEANRLFALLVEWMSIATGNALAFAAGHRDRARVKSVQ